MTDKEAIKKIYQLLLTAPHAPTVCAQLERIAREALAEHAMRETQRLGQEIEQEPVGVVHHKLTSTLGADYEQVAVFVRPLEPGTKLYTHPPQPEQEPVAWWNDTGTHIDLNVSGRGDPLYTVPPQRTKQKMVMWPCLIDTADFSKGTVTVVMQCDDYKVSAGTHWLSTISPKENQ